MEVNHPKISICSGAKTSMFPASLVPQSTGPLSSILYQNTAASHEGLAAETEQAMFGSPSVSHRSGRGRFGSGQNSELEELYP